MPLYEYYCADCRGKFQMLTTYEASVGDIVCTKCHGARVRKLFSVFAAPRGADAMSGGYSDSYNDGYDDGYESGAGGCSCGGACSCGGH